MEKGPAFTLFIFRIPLPYQVTVTLIGLGLLSIGILISNQVGLLDQFLSFPLIWFSISSFIWGYGVFCWATKKYEPILLHLHENFQVDKTEFNKIVHAYLQNEVYNDRSWLKYFLIFGTMLAVGVLYFLHSEILIEIPAVKLILADPFLLTYVVVLELLVSFLAVVGIYLVIIHSRFVRNISKYEINLNPFESQQNSSWDHLTNFSLHASITWFIALGLLVLLFLGPGNQLILLAIPFVIISVLTFLEPQFVLHRSIIKAKKRLLDIIHEHFAQNKNDDIKAIRYLLELEHAERIKEWPFKMETLNELLASTLIPFIPWVIQTLGLL